MHRQISKSLKVIPCIFVPPLFQMHDIQKVGQGHRVQFRQLYHSMAICQNLQMSSTHSCASFYRYRDIKMLNYLPPKSRSRSKSKIFAITPFDGKCQNLQLSPTHFYATSYRFRDINILNILPTKSSSRQAV